MIKPQKNLTVSVAAIHVCMLILFSQTSRPLQEHKKTPIKVHTAVLQPIPKSTTPPPTIQATSLPVPKEKQSPPKKGAPKPRPKPIPKKPTQPKKSTSKTPAITRRQNKQAIKKIDKALSKTDKAPVAKKKAPEKKSPPTVVKTDNQSTEEQNSFLTTYLSEVSEIFREHLTLSEKGKVKVTITVQPNGKIATIKPISSESALNLDYLMKVLPVVNLPPFQKTSDIEFTITFCDDL